jgi:hypothetical protein
MRLYQVLKRFAMVTLSAFALCLAAAPAQAATAPPSPGVRTGVTTTITQAQVQAWMTAALSAPAPTAAQMAAVDAYAKAHPFQGTVMPLPAPPGQKVGPLIGGGIYWWGVQVTLTNSDVHTIIQIIAMGGIGAAAGFLCGLVGGPAALFLAAACGVAGAVLGYVIAEIIWNNIGPYFRGHGVYVNYSFYNYYHWSWGTW